MRRSHALELTEEKTPSRRPVRTIHMPSPWEQAHVPIPDDAWEYQIRKALNDAAYQGLEYVPYCTTMPVKPNSEDVAFMWVRVERRPPARLCHFVLSCGCTWLCDDLLSNRVPVCLQRAA